MPFAVPSLTARVRACAGLVLASLLTSAVALPASAAPALPAGLVLRDQPSGQGAWELTDFGYLPDGRGMPTVGKPGTVTWVAPDGTADPIAKLAVVATQDLGLVGLAIASDYATSRRIYLARSVPTGNGSFVLRLARWRVTGTAEPTGLSGRATLLTVPGDSVVHGMTGIVAAQDGTVWVSVGDVADYTRVDATPLRAQNLDQPQGKILHLTSQGTGVPGNPLYDKAAPSSTRSKVFASGFRSRFGSHSTRVPALPWSATSIGTRGRRSTSCSRAGITAGHAGRVSPTPRLLRPGALRERLQHGTPRDASARHRCRRRTSV